MLRLQETDTPGQGNPQKEGQRQPQAVMRVERDLGQQVGQRNAEEHASGKGEGTADHHALLGKQARQAEDETERPQGAHEGERSIGQAD
jgi:hypothetical protein